MYTNCIYYPLNYLFLFLLLFCRVTFTIISKEQKIVWDVEVNFAHELLNEDSVKVRAVLGNVNERTVKKCIKGCPQGFAVFTSFATNIKNYVNSLRRPVNN